MAEKTAGNGEGVALEGPQAKKSKVSEEATNGTDTRLRKRKVALFVSYVGRGYNGMQKNPGVKTIEEDLIEALWRAGAVAEEWKERLDKMNFQRCARTDKGVSAAVNVVSLKMMIKDNILEEVNSHLSPQIRAVGFVRTTKKFDCKLSCSARSYEYVLPTFAFAPSYEVNHTRVLAYTHTQ
jgi:tRNA pseudouridine38-40 synthase